MTETGCGQTEVKERNYLWDGHFHRSEGCVGCVYLRCPELHHCHHMTQVHDQDS